MGFSVVPVTGKRPAIAWERYTKRHPTPAVLQAWFNGRYQQLAIVTGQISGLVVFDGDGREAMRFADEHIPATPMRTRTPRGGEHRYYDYDGLIGNRVGILGMPLDLRGEKGIAVAYGPGYDRIGDWTAPRPRFDPAWLPPNDRIEIATRIDLNSIDSQVATRLNLSRSKVYELIENGSLGHHRMGGAIRVSEEQVQQFLDSTKREIAKQQTTSPRPQLKHVRI